MENLICRPVPRRPASLGDRLRAILSIRGQRRRLRELRDDALDDIGITRRAAEREARRPIWDVPANWLR